MTTRQLDPILHYLQKMAPARPGAEETDGQLLHRFVRQGDEAAFALLLRRHGPLVLGVCRRVLRDADEAEDAFQATFLLLVRKASSLRRPDRLGPWLYGVAYRTAVRARGQAARWRPLGTLAEDLPAPAASDEVLWRDLRPVLDHAVERLPEKYRTPFVLCCLEGLTHAQAARRLGCPPNTVATRLARARQRLRSRLARQGLGACAGILVAGLAGRAAPTVPPALAAGTTRAALAFAAGPAASAGAFAPAVTALMKGVCKAMLMDKVRVLVLALAALGAVGSASVMTYRGLAGEPQRSGEEEASPPPPAVANEVPASVPAFPAPGTAPAAAAADPLPRERTTNFIVSAPSRRCARLVAEAAEQQRRLLARRWLGKELPDWSEPCRIRVAISPAPSQHAAGPDPGSSATTFAFDKGTLLSQDMHLEGSLEHILATLLPHEVTHTVFASYFGAPLPRWADEGGATLAEDDEEQQRYERFLRETCDEPDRRIPLRRLFPSRDYPKDIAAFYAESYSVVHFLVERKDRPTFLAFVKQGMQDGWDEAVKAHYGFRNVEDLEKAWQARLPRQEDPHGRSASRTDFPADPRRFPASPPPVMPFALMTDKGLLVRTRNTVAIPVRQEQGTAYQVQTAENLDRYQGADIRAFHPGGKRIDVKSLAALLPEEKPVLVSADGQDVDPFYLQLVKEEAVILVLPDRHLGVPIPQPAPPAR